ncbi:MAG: DNA polymerase I [Ruminococcaceae bacterium]|nr:DNA polymerase I [Oscillospiraceae bacterium]
MQKKLLVIDGNSILNRAFYGVRPLTTKDGLPTNALFGFSNILLRHLEAIRPDYAAVAFDVKHPTFRHLAYGEYKAGRKGMPEELAVQLPYAKELCEAMGLHVLEQAGFEADDLLGTLAEQAKSHHVDCDVLTGDRDSLQLIGDGVCVLLAGNSDTVRFDETAFVEKYGVSPSVFVDVKALMGDSSDNIPGVKGIGEKTALALISQYGSLNALYEGFEGNKHPDKLKEKLRDGKDDAYLSLFLSRIKTDVPLPYDFEDLSYNGFVNDALCTLLTKLEFNAMIKRLGLETGEAQAVAAECKEASLAELPGGVYALNRDEEHLYAANKETCFVLPLSELPALLKDGQYEKILFDSKEYAREALANGFELQGCLFDVMLAAYVLDPADGTSDLAKLSTKYLGKSGEAEGASAAAILFELYLCLSEKMKEEENRRLYEEIERPLAFTLARMEHLGFKVDEDRLNAYGKVLEEASEALKERIYALSGCEFNINSPKQLGEVLFERLGLPHGKKTKSGYSTSADILEKLRFAYPIVDDILEYRQLVKLKGTYTDGLVKVISSDGRIHTRFNQALTQTGRLSSAEPNLQNIPIRTEKGRELRRCFVPENDSYVLVDADYSQIELRILAHIAEDTAMIEAFQNGDDIHTITASQVFGVSPDSVTPELRKRAKAVNFGIVYGISDFSLSQDLGVSKNSAKAYIDAYLAHYSGIAAYLRNIVEEAKNNGYVKTIFGRKRYIPELTASKAMMRAFGERVAMNSPIQGSSADIIKIAMINAEKKLKESGLDARLILQVHDELVVESHKECADRVAEILKKEMEQAVSLSLPLTVDVKIGKDWLEAH